MITISSWTIEKNQQTAIKKILNKKIQQIKTMIYDKITCLSKPNPSKTSML